MVKKQNRLFLRKHTYYVRIAVPRDLFFIVKINEVRYSLNTKNYYDACQKVRIISVMLDILFNKVRNTEITEDRLKDTFNFIKNKYGYFLYGNNWMKYLILYFSQ